jgi:hypothetical protein
MKSKGVFGVLGADVHTFLHAIKAKYTRNFSGFVKSLPRKSKIFT